MFARSFGSFLLGCLVFPLLFGVDYWRVPGTMIRVFVPVDWVRALTCLVPVHVRCSFGGSSLKSFTGPRFLLVPIIQCFSGVMAVLLPSEIIRMDNATSHL